MRATTVFIILSAILHSQTCALCSQYCLAGDVLNTPTQCYHDVAATLAYNCPSGYTMSDTTCSMALCNSGSNANIGSKYSPSCPGSNTVCSLTGTCSCQSGGYCCFCYSGSRAAPKWTGSYYSCNPSDGGPGGSYMTTPSGQRWCYGASGSGINCPGSFTGDGGTCQVAATSSYTCPSGFTMLSDGITCRQIYAPSPITTSAQCGISPSATGCDWCSGINVCMPSGTCYGSCPQATSSQATCTRTGSLCQWCSTLSVCQLKTDGCYSSCLLATANSTVCSYSGACKWCSAIGVCQPNSSVCYSSCLIASPEPAVCAGSLACQWCGTMGYCTPNTKVCHTVCTTIAPDDPAICQVASIQVACEWCGALQYCVGRGDGSAYRCASRCETMIWRQDICSGALDCHWCAQHGGRCKPIAGQSQGFLSWRREVECETGTETKSLSMTTASSSGSSSGSFSHSCSSSKTATTTALKTLSVTVNSSSTIQLTSSLSHRRSSTLTISASPSVTMTLSRSAFSPSLSTSRTVLTTPSLTLIPTRTATRTDTVVLKDSRQVLEAATKVMTVTAALAGLLGVLSLSSGGPMLSNARLSSQLSIINCDAEGVSLSLLTNPIQLCLGADTTQCYRGSIVGNTGLLMGVFIAGLGADWLRRSVSISLRVPPLVISAFALLLGGWTSCSASLVVLVVTPAVDVALGLLGGALSVVGLCWSWWCATHLGDCKLVGRVEDGDNNGGVVTTRERLIGVLRGNCKWCSCSDKFRHGQVYKDARVAWYGAADCSFTVCCAVLEGLSNAAVWGDTYCSAASWLFLLMAVCLLVIAVYFRPMLSHADNVFLWSSCGVAVVASALQLIGMLTQNVALQVAGAVVALLGVFLNCVKLVFFFALAMMLRLSQRHVVEKSPENTILEEMNLARDSRSVGCFPSGVEAAPIDWQCENALEGVLAMNGLSLGGNNYASETLDDVQGSDSQCSSGDDVSDAAIVETLLHPERCEGSPTFLQSFPLSVSEAEMYRDSGDEMSQTLAAVDTELQRCV